MDDINGNVDYLLEVMNIALDGSDLVSREAYRQAHRYQAKGERDFSLEVDGDIEQSIKAILMSADSSIPVLGEESAWTGEASAERYWVVDPIDGTVNYDRQIPLFGTCIALIENKRPVMAGISLPILEERFVARRGLGAHLNGEKITIRDGGRFDGALVGMGDYAVGEGAAEKNKLRFAVTQYLAGRVLRIRMPGSAAIQLAWLACGRLDASVTLSNTAWDVQAGVLIAQEAGAEVFDGDGSEHTTASSYTLASHSDLKEAILAGIAS